MTTFIKPGAALLALSTLLGGCAVSSPQFEANFGNSVRATVASQVADPAAVRNTDPVTGLDGRAAQMAQIQYEKSFAKPAATQESMISGSGK
ncbi:MAG: hypothetical protein V4633_07530 [Pseudomonadota bacterium]